MCMGQGKASLPSPVGRAQSLKIELSLARNADQVRMCSLLWLTMPAHTRQPASVKGNQRSLNTSILLPSPGRGVKSTDVWVITKSRVWALRWLICNPIFHKPLRGCVWRGICLSHLPFASLSPYLPPTWALDWFCCYKSPLMDAVGGGKSLEVPTGKLDGMDAKTKVPYTETSPELIFMQHPLIVSQPATVHLSKHLPIGGVHHVKCLQP